MQNFRGERDKKEGGGGKRDVVLGGGAFGENGLPSSAPPSQDGEVSKRKRGEVSKAEMRDGKSSGRGREKRETAGEDQGYTSFQRYTILFQLIFLR